MTSLEINSQVTVTNRVQHGARTSWALTQFSLTRVLLAASIYILHLFEPVLSRCETEAHEDATTCTPQYVVWSLALGPFPRSAGAHAFKGTRRHTQLGPVILHSGSATDKMITEAQSDLNSIDLLRNLSTCACAQVVGPEISACVRTT